MQILSLYRTKKRFCCPRQRLTLCRFYTKIESNFPDRSLSRVFPVPDPAQTFMPRLVHASVLKLGRIPGAYKNPAVFMSIRRLFFSNFHPFCLRDRFRLCSPFRYESRLFPFLRVKRLGSVHFAHIPLECYRMYIHPYWIKRALRSSDCQFNRQKAKKSTQTGIESSACVLRRHNAYNGPQTSQRPCPPLTRIHLHPIEKQGNGE